MTLRALAAGAVVATVLGGCGQASDESQRRVLSAHNLVMHAGYSEMGPITSGELRPQENLALRASFEAGQCYLLAVFGEPDLVHVGVSVTGPDGANVAQSSGSGSTATVSFCAERSEEHSVHVTALRGAGAFQMAYWRGAGAQAAGGSLPGGAGGSTLRLGAPTSGVLPYGGYSEYILSVDSPRMVTIDLISDEFDCYLYILQDGVEIAADDDGGDGLNSHLSEWLEPGTYTIRIGSYADSGGGSFDLIAR